MKLTPTRTEYTFEDASGYRFVVSAENVKDYGWTAVVTIAAHGLKAPEDAVKALAPAVEDFLRQLGEVET